MGEITQKTKRFHSLDFLKFLSAVMIVFHHFQQMTNTKFEHINFYFGRIYFGNLVELFFIISGFVTAFGLQNKKPENFKKWIIGKSVRIYPMTMLSVAIAFCFYFLYRVLFGVARVPFGLWRLFTSFTLTFVGGGLMWGLASIMYSGMFVYSLFVVFGFMLYNGYVTDSKLIRTTGLL